MRLVSFRVDDRDTFGGTDGSEAVIDLGGSETTLAQALERYPEPAALAALDGPAVAASDVEWLPPIPQPGKVFCVGLNFPDHVSEVGHEAVAKPTLLARSADSFVGHEQPVLRPAASAELDWEGEVAVVVGRPAWQVAEAEALSVVAGYTCAWPITVSATGRRTARRPPRAETLAQRVDGSGARDCRRGRGPGAAGPRHAPQWRGCAERPARQPRLLEVEVAGIGVLRNPVADLADQAP